MMESGGRVQILLLGRGESVLGFVPILTEYMPKEPP